MSAMLTLDACAVIGLTRAGVFGALPVAYASVAISPDVRDECRSCADAVGAAVAAGWLVVCQPEVRPTVVAAPSRGRGDWSALALAAQLQTPLATDDGKLRARAKARGVPTLGVLDLLVVLKRCGAIASVSECIERMRQNGELLSEADCVRATQDANELT